MGIAIEAVEAGLKTFRPAFGRSERFTIAGKPAMMLLVKNPVGANQILRLLRSEPGAKCLLLALNDGLADGQDISWVWDADYEGLQGQVKWVVVSGRRAQDMALRLKYAGWFDAAGDGGHAATSTVLPNPERALRTALYRLDPEETLYLLPTYTAMLELRGALSRMGVVRPFWENLP